MFILTELFSSEFVTVVIHFTTIVITRISSSNKLIEWPKKVRVAKGKLRGWRQAKLFIRDRLPKRVADLLSHNRKITRVPESLLTGYCKLNK